MKEILQSIGIENLNSFIYEFDSVRIDWWDNKNETSIEIEIHEIENEVFELNVVFCPEVEGIVERTIILNSIFKFNSLENNAFIAKVICENLIPENTFTFSEEQNTYIIETFEDLKNVFKIISNLISNKDPKLIMDLNKVEDFDEEEMPYDVGDNLDHFIGMMYMNSIEITKENIIEYIGMALEFEGKEYFEILKEEVDVELHQDFQGDYGIETDGLELIKDTIRNYTLE
ncbi:hypothetical protein [Aureivirga sp. CE67]|uniref:hypothetical protein n=1 Tax=Aureivirga sp. CE67 TaxID=1788983 RepID=UPI0018CB9450|nr:hypothetical protein [Aureivirga sp. CE67]